MSFEGILRPVQDSRDAWLFPAMAAPWRRGLGADGIPQHYPKPLMVIDAENLQDVLDDEILHCVCNALCCDRQTVFVRGSYSMDPGDAEVVNFLDGKNRDWKLHLELRPLSGRCVLEIPIEVTLTATLSDDISGVVTDIRRKISVVQNIQGVIFRDFDFRISLTIYCASADRDKIKYRIQSLLDCVTNCPGCAFTGCTSTITVTIHNLNQHKPRYIQLYDPPDDPGGPSGPGSPGWGGGGAGGGSGGGGGGPGTPGWGSGEYDWDRDGDDDDDDDEEEMPWLTFGEKDVVIRAAAYSNCREAVFFDTQAKILIQAESLTGAESLAVGWQNCGGWLHRLSQGNIFNRVKVAGSGQSYTVSDGSHGIANYSLTALAESHLIAYSGGGEISTFVGLAEATALCTAGNQPYHTDKDGNTSNGKIGGAARAMSFGLVGNKGGSISACVITCNARAKHPVSYAALAVPYRSNTAQQIANSGSREYCDSNLPGWCTANMQ